MWVGTAGRRYIRCSLDSRTLAESWHESNLWVVDVFIDDGDGAVGLFECVLRSEWDVHAQFVGSHFFPEQRCASVFSLAIVSEIHAVHFPSHSKRFLNALRDGFVFRPRYVMACGVCGVFHAGR